MFRPGRLHSFVTPGTLGLPPPPPRLHERVVATSRHDDVVAGHHADDLRSDAEPVSEVSVLRRRNGIAARVVVDEHHAVGTLSHDWPEGVSR